MPLPAGVPGVTTIQEDYVDHLKFDGVGGQPVGTILPGWSEMENLLGHRSGLGVASPWSTPPAPKRPPLQEQSGAVVAYAATTLTDASKAWTPADVGAGALVSYGAATLTNTGRAWVVNMFAGQPVVTASGKSGVVASNTATVITLAANWVGGTPAAQELYTVFPLGWIGRQIITATGKTGIVAYHSATVITLTAAGWTGGTPAANEQYIIGPYADPGRHVDNWSFGELRMRGNTDAF